MVSNKTMAQIVSHFEAIIQRLEMQNSRLLDRLMAKSFEEYKLTEVAGAGAEPHLTQSYEPTHIPGTVYSDLPERS